VPHWLWLAPRVTIKTHDRTRRKDREARTKFLLLPISPRESRQFINKRTCSPVDPELYMFMC